MTATATELTVQSFVVHEWGEKFRGNERIVRERMVAHFGVPAHIVAETWNWMTKDGQKALPKNVLLKHLLWALYFWKTCPTERVGAWFCQSDEKTYRHYVWIVTNHVANLDGIICWNYRKFGCEGIQLHGRRLVRWCTVDGIDFKIQEPRPFNPKWCSHKFKSAGLRYEICVSLAHGWIVWYNGPFAAGSFPDGDIARFFGLRDHLDRNEQVVADGGFRDPETNMFDTPNGLNDRTQYLLSLYRSRHETVNGRLREFAVLRDTYRHGRNKHGQIFAAVAKVVQLSLWFDRKTFPINMGTLQGIV